MNLPPAPKFFQALRHYNRRDLVPDLIAGFTVGLVALPLAMAFGIASGVTPQAGIYTAIIGGLICAIFGGASIQVSGPTGAFVVIVAGIIAKHDLSGLLVVTFMAGLILLFLGLSGLGNAIKFIPRPIVIGFTNGIALLIASTQIQDFLGIKPGPVPHGVIDRLAAYWDFAHTIHIPALALSSVSLALILLTPRFTKRIPGSILALLAGTAAVAIFNLPVETIGTRFGGIPSGFASLQIPAFQPGLILPLLPSALTVAILAAVESLLSAVVADGMTGDRHDSNTELIGQGLANLVVPFFGGIPVTGAIARSATNYRSGARTPVAAVVHALTLLALVLAAAPFAKFIPLATLSAVLFVVAYNMGEWREIPGILRLEMADKGVWAITFLLTVVADLTVAVEVGMALACLLYIHRVSETTTVSTVTESYVESGKLHSLQAHDIPDYVSILRIHGPFLFGTTSKLAEETRDLDRFKPIVILRLRNMNAIDATGVHELETLAARLEASGRALLLCGARPQPRMFLRRADFVQHIGASNILPHVKAALTRAAELHAG